MYLLYSIAIAGLGPWIHLSVITEPVQVSHFIAWKAQKYGRTFSIPNERHTMSLCPGNTKAKSTPHNADLC